MSLNTYYVINEVDRDKVNFKEIVQRPEKVRPNLAGTQFIIKNKIGSGTPTFIEDGTVVPDAVLNHSDCLALMANTEWSNPIV